MGQSRPLQPSVRAPSTSVSPILNASSGPASTPARADLCIDDLPLDVQGVVLGHLPPTDIAAAARACRSLRAAAQTPWAWRHHLAALPHPLAPRWRSLSPEDRWTRASGALWGACRAEPVSLEGPATADAAAADLGSSTCIALTAESMAVGTSRGEVAFFDLHEAARRAWTAAPHRGCVRALYLPAEAGGPQAKSWAQPTPLISLGCDGRVRLICRGSGGVRHSFGPFGSIRLHAFDPACQCLAAVDSRPEVQLLALAGGSGAPRWAALPGSTASQVEAMACAGGRLALAYPCHIDIIDLPQHPRLASPSHHRRLTLAPNARVSHLAWQADSLVAAHRRPEACAYVDVWEAASGACTAHICGPPGRVTSLRTVGDIALVGLSDGSLWARDLRPGSHPAVMGPPFDVRQARPVQDPPATARGVALVAGCDGALMLHFFADARRLRLSSWALIDRPCAAAVLVADSVAIIEGVGVGTARLLRARPLSEASGSGVASAGRLGPHVGAPGTRHVGLGHD